MSSFFAIARLLLYGCRTLLAAIAAAVLNNMIRVA